MIADRDIAAAMRTIDPPTIGSIDKLRVIDHRDAHVSYQPEDVGSGLNVISGSTTPTLVTADDVSFDLARVLDRFRNIVRLKSKDGTKYLTFDPTHTPSLIVSEGGFTLILGYGSSLRVYALATQGVTPADRVYVYEYGNVFGTVRDRDQGDIRTLVAEMQTVASAAKEFGSSVDED